MNSVQMAREIKYKCSEYAKVELRVKLRPFLSFQSCYELGYFCFAIFCSGCTSTAIHATLLLAYSFASPVYNRKSIVYDDLLWKHYRFKV